MQLKGIIEFLESHPDFRKLLRGVNPPGVPSTRAGLSWKGTVLESAKPPLLAALHLQIGRPIVVITARPETAKYLAEQLGLWNTDGSVQLFPEPDVLPYERRSWELSLALDRIKVLHALTLALDVNPLIVTSLFSVAVKTLSKDYFCRSITTIRNGDQIDSSGLLKELISRGYQSERAVEIPGTFTRRGGIIDIFSPAEEHPARVELWGNEVESIRLFDPQTQRSLGRCDSITLIPASEALVDGSLQRSGHEIIKSLDLTNCSEEAKARIQKELVQYLDGSTFEGREGYAHLFQDGTFLDYLPEDALVIVDDPTSLKSKYHEIDEHGIGLRQHLVQKGELPSNFPTPYLSWDALESKINDASPVLRLYPFEREGSSVNSLSSFAPAPNYGGHLKIFLREVRSLLNDGYRITIVSHQAPRLSELLNDVDIWAPVTPGVDDLPMSKSLVIVHGSLGEGWMLRASDESPSNSLILLTDKELFGFTKQRRQVRKRPVQRRAFAADLAVGDYVVHVDHGIGRFTGVTIMRREEGEREYLTIEYADNARLYVPSDQVDRVTPYVGPGDKSPQLTRLGTQEWARAKGKVKESAEQVARELLDLYAMRQVRIGYACSPDTPWQQELEGSFSYVETADQLETIAEVKADMESPRPMDRLVCGDVGYGKTEVALRASFKAVMDGRQVAILVPTTVLAQQHLQTFQTRLKAFPITVEVLSRFRSSKEQAEVIEGLKSGAVDICIGTHRLLQKDVLFKNLGLVVIDEEQRFGVNHKEQLKKMREEVDVLTLTATPIPRTLHMSLVSVRDMSTMETPPEERLPIKTYVQDFDESVIREAILREVDRGGQVFFVHNRVQNINVIAEQLHRLVPSISVAVAHGQMPEHQLEEVMVDFVKQKYDLLVCSTIIESGLDMPNVNTIIVNNADKMGLAQLYQLRGRVGRGVERAYAYFFYDRYKALSDVAEKRLRAIQAATELGAGFRIAMKDLEIRGAGNLLGVEQSGHIAAVGFDLYCSMLARAVEELKEQSAGILPQGRATFDLRRVPTTAIDIPIPAYLPEQYVEDIDLRLALYQRLARASKVSDIDDIAQELRDRFGPFPAEVDNLLYLVRVKLTAASRGIEKIRKDDQQLIIVLSDVAQADRTKLASYGSAIHVGMKQIRLHLPQLHHPWRQVLEEVIQDIRVPAAPTTAKHQATLVS